MEDGLLIFAAYLYSRWVDIYGY